MNENLGQERVAEGTLLDRRGAMKYVIVKYPEERSVYADGEYFGLTEEVLRIDAGTHLFDLGEPVDYTPASQSVAITGGTNLIPFEIIFEPLP